MFRFISEFNRIQHYKSQVFSTPNNEFLKTNTTIKWWEGEECRVSLWKIWGLQPQLLTYSRNLCIWLWNAIVHTKTRHTGHLEEERLHHPRTSRNWKNCNFFNLSSATALKVTLCSMPNFDSYKGIGQPNLLSGCKTKRVSPT